MSLSHCQDIGRMLHMSPDEVVTCLKFFHMLNMLLYYPNSPAKDIVFIQLDSIIDILKDLMIMVSRDRPRWTRASTEVMGFCHWRSCFYRNTQKITEMCRNYAGFS